MKKNSIYKISVIGLMAAMCFVGTFVGVKIQTPLGPTMVHLGNIFCILSGLLFGGVTGGLSAGIGSGLFDLVDPIFISSAPFTFAFKFLMAFVAGKVSRISGNDGSKTSLNIAAAVCGAVTYTLLYVGKNVAFDLFLYHKPIETVLIANAMKMGTSLINGGVAVVCAVILAKILKVSLRKTGIFEKLR